MNLHNFNENKCKVIKIKAVGCEISDNKKVELLAYLKERNYAIKDNKPNTKSPKYNDSY